MNKLRTGIASVAAFGMSLGLSGCGESEPPSRAEKISTLQEAVADKVGSLATAQQRLDAHTEALPDACADEINPFLDKVTPIAVAILKTAGICPDPNSLITSRDLYEQTQKLYTSLVANTHDLEILQAEEFASHVTTTTLG